MASAIFGTMKRILGLVLATLMTGLSPVLAQQFPTVPDHTVIGRIGTGSGSGPSQAIPFASLASGLFANPVIGTLNVNPPAKSSAQGLVITQTGAGTASAQTGSFLGYAYNRLIINDNLTSSNNGPNFGLHVDMTESGTAFSGGGALFGGVTVSGTTTNPSAAPAGVTSYANVTSNYLGGTALAPAGASYGFSAYGLMTGNNVHLSNVTGGEIDIQAVGSGSTVAYKSGLQIVALISDAIQGSLFDGALSISSGGGSAGWKNGILFSNANGQHPMAATGKLFATQGSATIATGFDISSYTSATAFKSPGVILAGGTGGGNLATGTGLSLTDGTVTGILQPSTAFTNSFAIGTSSNHTLSFVTNGVTRAGIGNTGAWLWSNYTQGVIVADPSGNIGSAALTNGQLAVGQTGAAPLAKTISGDATLAASGALTVTKTNGTNFGTAATQNTGTSGANLPFLNGANTWSGVDTWTLAQAANTSTDGIVLLDNTVATSGNQQYSPRIRLSGQGWKTNATAASQQVDWLMENRPIQGTVNPATSLAFGAQINGGGYVDHLLLQDNGSGGLTVLFNGVGSSQFGINVGGTTNGVLFADGTQVILQSSISVPLIFKANGAEFARGNAAGGFTAVSYVQTGAVAVASLPSCAAGTKGARHFVTDANATFTAGIGAVVAAGGANNVPVTCDGTNWRIGANDNIPLTEQAA